MSITETKKCTGECGEIKLLNCFYFRKDSGKYRNECKNCIDKKHKNYVETYKEDITKYKNEWYKENFEEISAKKKEDYIENREEILERSREERKERSEEEIERDIKRAADYYQENKEETKKTVKKYAKEHRKETNKRARERRKTDPLYKLRSYISGSIGEMLRSQGSSKAGNSISKYLFYSNEILKNHIESLFEPWMNWGNRGSYRTKDWDDFDPSTWKWQLDHIIPHSTFEYKSMDCEEFRACWALSNLRPLSAKDNLLDGATKIRHKKNNNKK